MKHILSALLLMSGGCSLVLSTQPIGEVVAIDPADWDGVWQDIGSTDAPVELRVIDADNGELSIAFDEPQGQCDRGEFRAFVREAEDWTFLSVRLPAPPCDATAEQRYVWMVAEVDDGVLLLWGPDSEKFAALVEQGELPGEAEHDTLLYPFEERGYELITSEEHGPLFDWRHPAVLKRIAPASAPAVTP